VKQSSGGGETMAVVHYRLQPSHVGTGTHTQAYLKACRLLKYLHELVKRRGCGVAMVRGGFHSNVANPSTMCPGNICAGDIDTSRPRSSNMCAGDGKMRNPVNRESLQGGSTMCSDSQCKPRGRSFRRLDGEAVGAKLAAAVLQPRHHQRNTGGFIPSNTEGVWELDMEPGGVRLFEGGFQVITGGITVNVKATRDLGGESMQSQRRATNAKAKQINRREQDNTRPRYTYDSVVAGTHGNPHSSHHEHLTAVPRHICHLGRVNRRPMPWSDDLTCMGQGERAGTEQA